MTRLTRKLAALASGAILASGMTMVTQAPADAAVLPVCNRDTSMVKQGLYAHVPTLNGSTSCRLYYRASSPFVNEGVRALQRALVTCAGKQLALDGSFGPATERALEEFQDSKRLEGDGVYGPNTRRALGYAAYDPSVRRYVCVS